MNSKPLEVTFDQHDCRYKSCLYHQKGIKLCLGRVRERAEARIEAYLKEHEEEEKAKRIEASPGGLGQVQNE